MHCTDCETQFDYPKGEAEAYQRFNVPLPLNCPDCRQRRRMIFRNEKNLYYNKSCLSGKTIIALYPTNSPFKIIDQDEWWDDSFDATIYGRDFDFSRPFFEQFKNLQKEVPRWSRIFVNCENSDFTNNCADVKNGYLSFSSYNSENIYYCTRVLRLNTCVDCLNVKDSEYCSQCNDCGKCYNTHFSQLSENCTDSYFLFDCKNCRDCILCAQIRNKQYMVHNKQYTKEEYEKLKEDFLIKQLPVRKKEIAAQLEELKKQVPIKHLRLINAENCVGDFINDSKNVTNGFYAVECEDCINVYGSSKLKNCYDNYVNDKSELCLEGDTSYEIYDCKFCTYTGSSNRVSYCDQCFYINDSFGCIGLKHEKYMILNKKYSKEEYEQMRKKIDEHMKRTGEFGKPFPSTLSPFPYNITVAQDFYPIDQVFAQKLGYMWHREGGEAAYFGKRYEIPTNINDVDESICDKILVCEETGKNYKLIPQELKFYKTFRLPIPRISPDQRYRNLLSLEPPKKLIDTVCFYCEKEIATVYPREWGYKIACEKCYLGATY